MIRVVQMTDKEKIALYMKLPKIKIAKMLLECNKHIDNLRPTGASWFKVTPPTSTSLNEGYTYEATFTATSSYPEDKSKSTKTGKGSLAKKRRRVKRVGSKKR